MWLVAVLKALLPLAPSAAAAARSSALVRISFQYLLLSAQTELGKHRHALLLGGEVKGPPASPHIGRCGRPMCLSAGSPGQINSLVILMGFYFKQVLGFAVTKFLKYTKCVGNL